MRYTINLLTLIPNTDKPISEVPINLLDILDCYYEVISSDTENYNDVIIL